MQPQSFEAYARAECLRLLDALGGQLRNAAADQGVDAVHDVRVAIRRFTQALRVFGPLWPRKAVKGWRKPLKAVLDAAAVVRDIDIGVDLLHGVKLPRDHSLWDDLRLAREAGTLRLQAALCELRPEEYAAACRDWLLTAPLHSKAKGQWDPEAPVAFNARRLARLAKRYFALGEDLLDGKPGPDELHQFRLATKRFRYTLELFRPVYGPALAAKIAELRRAQDLLGEMNDCSVTARRAAKAAPAPALDRAIERLERTSSARAAAFGRYWRDSLASASAAGRWRRYLAVYAGRTGKRRPSA